MEKPRHWIVENIFESPYNPFEAFLTVQHWGWPQIYFYGWWLEISFCEFSLLDGPYSPYRVLICFRPASRMAWPRRPHRSYLSLASSRRSMPSLSVTKPFMQTSGISHSWLAAYLLARKSDHQSQDGPQRASRYCLSRDDEISKVKTYSMSIITCNQKSKTLTEVELPILMYLLKNSPSSISDSDMMTREYWMLLILAWTSFQMTSYNSWGRIICTYIMTSAPAHQGLNSQNHDVVPCGWILD